MILFAMKGGTLASSSALAAWAVFAAGSARIGNRWNTKLRIRKLLLLVFLVQVFA